MGRRFVPVGAAFRNRGGGTQAISSAYRSRRGDETLTGPRTARLPSSFPAEAGLRLLLCSDGLSDMLRAAEISRIIGCAGPEQAADKLLEQSLDNGGRDNVSLILIDLTTQGEESCNG